MIKYNNVLYFALMDISSDIYRFPSFGSPASNRAGDFSMGSGE